MFLRGVLGALLQLMPFIVVITLLVMFISSTIKSKNNPSYYTIDDYKAYVIKKAIEDRVEELVYEPKFGLPENVYEDLSVMRRGNRYHREDLITGKYNNIYFVQSDLKVQYTEVTVTTIIIQPHTLKADGWLLIIQRNLVEQL